MQRFVLNTKVNCSFGCLSFFLLWVLAVFMYSFLSGLVEPVGAILCYFLFMSFLTPLILGLLIATVAGIMVFISLDQLLPASGKYGEHQMTTYGVVLGMVLMSVSLTMLVGHSHVH